VGEERRVARPPEAIFFAGIHLGVAGTTWRDRAARRKAGSMRMTAIGFHHTGTPQVVT
jgi:hypothetical protein